MINWPDKCMIVHVAYISHAFGLAKSTVHTIRDNVEAFEDNTKSETPACVTLNAAAVTITFLTIC